MNHNMLSSVHARLAVSVMKPTHTGPKTESLQGQWPCHPSDQSQHLDIHTGTRACTRLADEQAAERHKPTQTGEVPNFQDDTPKGEATMTPLMPAPTKAET